jgi:hypothetical protein
VKQFFELAQLSLEAHIRKNDWSAFAGKGERGLEVHIVLMH